MTTHERHDVSDHRQLDCLFNILFRLSWKKPSKLHIIDRLWEIHPWPIDSLTKGQQCKKSFHVTFPPYTRINTLRLRQNGRHFTDDTFKRIFVNENVRILIEISLKFVPNGPINNIPALVQVMAWRLPGDKPLSEPMMVCLPKHIWVTRPQWVNSDWGCD